MVGQRRLAERRRPAPPGMRLFPLSDCNFHPVVFQRSRPPSSSGPSLLRSSSTPCVDGVGMRWRRPAAWRHRRRHRAAEGAAPVCTAPRADSFPSWLNLPAWPRHISPCRSPPFPPSSSGTSSECGQGSGGTEERGEELTGGCLAAPFKRHRHNRLQHIINLFICLLMSIAMNRWPRECGTERDVGFAGSAAGFSFGCSVGSVHR